VINGIAPLITYWNLAEILKILVIPLWKRMKKIFLIVLLAGFFILVNYSPVKAQCSICAKSVQQMGEKPARGFNSGIIYLMLVPYALIGVIGYKWWKSNH